MTHSDHVRLLKKAIPEHCGGIWADLGSGEGAFTLALRDLAGNEVVIYSIDKNERSLNTQKKAFAEHFPDTTIHYLVADFTQALPLPPLDGIILANALHFVKDQESALMHLRGCLKPHGKLVLVEYNVDQGNQWVPYPLSFTTFSNRALTSGFTKPLLLETVPSQFLQEIYSAIAYTTKP